MLNKCFVRWCAMVMLVLFGAFWLFVNGTVDYFVRNDITHIPTAIAALTVMCTAWLGYLSYQTDGYRAHREEDPIDAPYLSERKDLTKGLEWNWFLSDFIMGIGLFGTVVGCIMLFSVNLGGNVTDIGRTINELYKSLSVAFFSTAVAVFGSLFCKVQAMNIQQMLGDENE